MNEYNSQDWSISYKSINWPPSFKKQIYKSIQKGTGLCHVGDTNI